MFAPYCAECGSRVLLGPRRVLSLSNAASGRIRVLLQCFCGATLDSDAVAPPARVAAEPVLV
ncbi:MAG: hypothetical protein ACT4QG_21255 [Sporichthyaceae bacterium]